eukprot:15966256-Heterocapsa_arctica.AAC.1
MVSLLRSFWSTQDCCSGVPTSPHPMSGGVGSWRCGFSWSTHASCPLCESLGCSSSRLVSTSGSAAMKKHP